ncbi:MAG: 50S ribosomal protein L10 [Bryobacteraceae bacterium]|nr:50S ribosomal protein L10 [Bryobacteraceae bacterium]
MKDKNQKKRELDALRADLEATRNLFVTSFNKLTVAQDYALRKAIKEVGGDYQVVKNTIAEKASEGLDHAPALKGLVGMNSVAWTQGDVVALAKTLTKYAKDNPAFTFKAGVVEGRVIDIKAVNELANLPSKEEIYSKLLWLINAPAQRLVTVTNAVGRNLAVVVDQGVKENKFQA